MRVDEYVDQLEEHGAALADAAAAASLDDDVPTCPDWQLRDLLGHLGRVHRWAAMFVSTARTAPPTGDAELADLPPDDELLGWFRAGHADLVTTLRKARPDVDCWSFLPAPSPLTFWARRQAHETAIHRADADSVHGRQPHLSARFAVDGIDELLLGFFGRPRGRLFADPPVTLGISASDAGDGDCWSVAIGPSAREVTRGTDRGTCVVRGPAADLYLFLWNRRDVGGLDVSGHPKALNLWRSKANVRWS